MRKMILRYFVARENGNLPWVLSADIMLEWPADGSILFYNSQIASEGKRRESLRVLYQQVAFSVFHLEEGFSNEIIE
jgi:hypothetical protein